MFTANLGDRCVCVTKLRVSHQLLVSTALCIRLSPNPTTTPFSRCSVGLLQPTGRLLVEPLTADHSPEKCVHSTSPAPGCCAVANVVVEWAALTFAGCVLDGPVVSARGNTIALSVPGEKFASGGCIVCTKKGKITRYACHCTWLVPPFAFVCFGFLLFTFAPFVVVSATCRGWPCPDRWVTRSRTTWV